MNEAGEAFMDVWLDANVTKKHAKKPSARTIKSVAKRCVADAAAEGISLDALEEVVLDIEEAIADELNFVVALKAGDDPETDRDGIRAAAALDYEIDYLVVKTGVTREQARELINRHGNDRETLIKHARKLV